QWADPGEEELAMVEGEEATVEMEVLDTPQSSDTPVDESLSVETSEETTTSPPTERPTAEPPQTDVIFRIQVGTFDQRENAENVWRRLTQAGFDARISTYTENEQVRYRVQVGDFQTQDAANRVAEELRGMNFSAWVFPVG
ncbi:MAG TPA: SPOR domain-containing protein, partial [Firmicutes bacterium]|nr:SPOR domain-containing protein [Bacillota bacterium]